MNGFPNDVEIWNRRGEVANKLADVPSSEGIPINGVQTGRRGFRWRPDQPATITWVEALDGGDMKNKVPYRDQVMQAKGPFSEAPAAIARTEWRFANISFTDQGIALLTESDRVSRRTRTWLLEAAERFKGEGETVAPINRVDAGGECNRRIDRL